MLQLITYDSNRVPLSDHRSSHHLHMHPGNFVTVRRGNIHLKNWLIGLTRSLACCSYVTWWGYCGGISSGCRICCCGHICSGVICRGVIRSGMICCSRGLITKDGHRSTPITTHVFWLVDLAVGALEQECRSSCHCLCHSSNRRTLS